MTESTTAKPSLELPPIPPALLQTPRKVKAKRLGAGIWVLRLFLLPHTLIGLACAGAVVAYPLWIEYGTDYRAQVIDSRYTISTSSKGKSTDHFEITYTYMLNGQLRKHTEDVDEDIFIRVGGTRYPELEKPVYQSVTVRGLGRPPLYYEAVTGGEMSPWAKWGFILLFASFWNAIMCVFWWSAYFVPWRTRKLFRNGKVGFGVITSKYTTSGKNRTDYLEYDFFTEDGAAGHGKTAVTTKEDFERAAERENVIVLHADGKTKPSVLYAYGPYKCVE